MITRFNYVPVKPRDSSKDDEFIKYSYEKKIRVISTQKDGSVENFVEEPFWKEEKCSWSEFIASYDLGSVSEQVINHLTKGTPLVTAHTLPAGDYTQLEKGAEIKHEMDSKGITMEMLIQAFNESQRQNSVPVEEKKVEVNE